MLLFFCFFFIVSWNFSRKLNGFSRLRLVPYNSKAYCKRVRGLIQSDFKTVFFLTFVKKVMEYLCSGCFFLQNDIFYNDFLRKELIDISSDIFRAKLMFNPSEKSFKIGWRKHICHTWFVTRSEIYHFVLYMACWGMIFTKKKTFSVFLRLIFLCYYCSIDLKMQSEHSGLRPDTSSLVPLYFWSTYHKPSKFEQYFNSNLLNRLLINLVILTWTFSFNFKSIWIEGIYLYLWSF